MVLFHYKMHTARCTLLLSAPAHALIFISFDSRWGIDWNAMMMKRKKGKKSRCNEFVDGWIAATAAAGAPATARSQSTMHTIICMNIGHDCMTHIFHALSIFYALLSLLCFAVFFRSISFGSINDWKYSMHLQQIQYIILIWWHRRHRCITNVGVAPLLRANTQYVFI